MDDPWAHRSAKMRCSTCMWFVPKMSTAKAAAFGTLVEPEDAKDIVPVQARLGRCRRHAPTMSGYPAVFLDDWCGDHKLDENKTPVT